ncbi:hypothetical protein AB0D12_36150 [Streptomyces sp. NPDC048479]|uniref:hypothetical protein n=1 Tax=Streptomyces sp. NPDC048479 TaxID=3154725 RepID=UPI003412CDA5
MLTTLVQVAGLQWSVEDCFETAKTDCGLDQYEVRGWDQWHRHVTSSVAALAFLSVTAARTAHAAEVREQDAPDLDAHPVIAAPSPQLSG